MTSVIKNIQNHYQSAMGDDLLKYHCKEWNTDIFYRKTYPFKDEAKVIELQSQGKTVEALVHSLIAKARKQDGSKMFSDADKITLMNEADPKVVVKVASVINAAQAVPSMSDVIKE